MNAVVVLRCERASGRRYVRGVGADARALLKLLSLENCELSLVLTDDAAIQELNRTYRSKNSPTDVLSFPQLECEFAYKNERAALDCRTVRRLLGDVVISVDTALRQAEEIGATPESRVRTLLVHGILHLLGYDHEKSRAEARRMFARERELIAALASSRKRSAECPSAATPENP